MENHLPLSSFPLEHWSQLYLRRPMSFVFEIMASGNHSIVFDCTATTHVRSQSKPAALIARQSNQAFHKQQQQQ